MEIRLGDVELEFDNVYFYLNKMSYFHSLNNGIKRYAQYYYPMLEAERKL